MIHDQWEFLAFCLAVGVYPSWQGWVMEWIWPSGHFGALRTIGGGPIHPPFFPINLWVAIASDQGFPRLMMTSSNLGSHQLILGYPWFLHATKNWLGKRVDWHLPPPIVLSGNAKFPRRPNFTPWPSIVLKGIPHSQNKSETTPMVYV